MTQYHATLKHEVWPCTTCLSDDETIEDMVECSHKNCYRWYHYSCVSIKPNNAPSEADIWLCPLCRDQAATTKAVNSDRIENTDTGYESGTMKVPPIIIRRSSRCGSTSFSVKPSKESGMCSGSSKAVTVPTIPSRRSSRCRIPPRRFSLEEWKDPNVGRLLSRRASQSLTLDNNSDLDQEGGTFKVPQIPPRRTLVTASDTGYDSRTSKFPSIILQRCDTTTRSPVEISKESDKKDLDQEGVTFKVPQIPPRRTLVTTSDIGYGSRTPKFESIIQYRSDASKRVSVEVGKESGKKDSKNKSPDNQSNSNELEVPEPESHAARLPDQIEQEIELHSNDELVNIQETQTETIVRSEAKLRTPKGRELAKIQQEIPSPPYEPILPAIKRKTVSTPINKEYHVKNAAEKVMEKMCTRLSRNSQFIWDQNTDVVTQTNKRKFTAVLKLLDVTYGEYDECKIIKSNKSICPENINIQSDPDIKCDVASDETAETVADMPSIQNERENSEHLGNIATNNINSETQQLQQICSRNTQSEVQTLRNYRHNRRDAIVGESSNLRFNRSIHPETDAHSSTSINSRSIQSADIEPCQQQHYQKRSPVLNQQTSRQFLTIAEIHTIPRTEN